ncbi:MAG: ABC transporter substrate-binding protein, partial [Chloroflexota bacterium]
MMSAIDRGPSRASRRYVLGTAAATGATVLAACGPWDSREPGKASVSAEPAEVIWTSWATDELGKIRVQEQADGFAQEYPHIKVTIANVPSREYQDKLLTGLAAGAGPDVFRDNPSNALPLISQGHLADLEPLFKT